MTSPRPPRLRDTLSLEDRVRQDRRNLQQLGVGFADGRFPPIRPLGAAAFIGDLESDSPSLDTSQTAAHNTDRAVATGAGSITLELTYVPIDGSLHVRWNGIDQEPSEWTLTGSTVTFNDPHVKTGDVLFAAYWYFPSDQPEPLTYLDLMATLGPLVYPRLTDTSGTVMTDHSGNARDGAYVSGYTLGTGGLVPSLLPDTCVDWSTGSGRIIGGSWMGVATIGLKAWIELDTVGLAGIITRDQFPVNRCWNLRINAAGKVEFYFWTAGGAGPFGVTGATTLTTGTRYMVGASYDGATAKVFLNGAVDGTTAQTGALQNVSNTEIRIGCSLSAAGGAPAEHINGRIQEAAMFTSLTADNFADLYAAGIAS